MSLDPTNTSTSQNEITILGFGSLLSERSARTTFPNLTNFRLGRVPQYRRVFGHPASIFFQRGIANLDTLEISSLSVEYVSEDYPGFVAALFQVSNEHGEFLLEQSSSTDAIIPSQAFLEREEEFDIVQASFQEINCNVGGQGILCRQSTDETYIQRWGEAHFQSQYKRYGVDTIWNWPRDSGMRPCAVYLRHCYLAAQGMGQVCLDSFLDDTYLIDRTTTVREYMANNPHVLQSLPPPELAERYSG